MNKLTIIFAVFVAVCASTSAQPGPPSMESLYCQADYVQKEGLLDVQNYVNAYGVVVGDISKINCADIVKSDIEGMYNDLKHGQEQNPMIDCYIKSLKDANFHKLSFKMNSLHAFDIPKAQKDELTKTIQKEIDGALQQSMITCMGSLG